jgi:hypothetical protein
LLVGTMAQAQQSATTSNEVFVNIFLETDANENLSTNANLKSEVEVKPQGRVSQSCWRLRAVRRTLKGGYLTDRIFIPGKVYSQIGAKLVGLTFKIDCIAKSSSLMQAFITNRKSHNAPCRADGVDELRKTLKNVEQLSNELNGIRDRLHRAFPSIVSHSSDSSAVLHVESVPTSASKTTSTVDPKPSTTTTTTTTTTKQASANKTTPAITTTAAAATTTGSGGEGQSRVGDFQELVGGFWGAAAGRTKAFTKTALALTRTAAEASTEIVGSASKSAISAVRFSILPVREMINSVSTTSFHFSPPPPPPFLYVFNFFSTLILLFYRLLNPPPPPPHPFCV